MDTPLVAVERLTMRYGSAVVLEDVSLELHAGRVTCLLGENGAGKSTLIRILSGVVEPAAGVLRIAGDDVRLRSPREAQALGLATVHQDLALAPLLSVWRNFVLGREPTHGRGPLRRLDVRGARALTLQALARLGIEIRDVSQSVGSLSGGQRQALAMARAVHAGARVLILDEPTAALGVRQAERVLEVIEATARQGVAVLLVTHNPAQAFRAGHDFVVLQQGRVAGRWARARINALTLARAMAGESVSEA